MIRAIFDEMHAKARQGAGLQTMCRHFPELSPDDIEYWMRRNHYIRNDGSAGIKKPSKFRRVKA